MAGNEIPERWARHFRGQQRRLATHEGLDIGAAAVARRVASALDSPLLLSFVRRLWEAFPWRTMWVLPGRADTVQAAQPDPMGGAGCPMR